MFSLPLPPLCLTVAVRLHQSPSSCFPVFKTFISQCFLQSKGPRDALRFGAAGSAPSACADAMAAPLLFPSLLIPGLVPPFYLQLDTCPPSAPRPGPDLSWFFHPALAKTFTVSQGLPERCAKAEEHDSV